MFLGLLVLGTGATAGWSQPVPSDLLPDERNTIDVFRRVAPAVVFIKNAQVYRDWFRRNVMEQPLGTGSGFVWDRRGHIVTNYHVIRDGNSFTVTFADGSSYRAEAVGSDPNKDLAVLRIEAESGTLAPLQLGDSSSLVVGQKVLAIGNTFGLDQTLTTGVISALGREIKSVGGTTITDVIQTDASINPGNSGGPLLDSAGRLIGVNTMIYSTSGASAGIGFAVPVNIVRSIVPQLIEYGHVRRARLGIYFLPDDYARRLGVRGVAVAGLQRGGPAAQAGLEPATQDRWGRVYLGDVIVGIDDVPIESFDDLFLELEGRDPGERVTVHYVRDGRRRSVELRLKELSD
jgi:S1-C subfamily serine protease